MIKKVLVLATCMVFLMAGAAQADFLQLGGSYSSIPFSVVNGNMVTEGGGSIDVSYLNGNQLSYLYCVDLFKNVYVNNTYPSTVVNNTGYIYGSLLTNAGQVAWLLSNYGTAGQGDAAIALQAAIWNVINGDNVYRLDNAAPQYNLYNSYLTALGSNTGNVSDFLWITPGTSDTAGQLTQYQGLVGITVPEPGVLTLLGLGLVALGITRRRSK
jgi:hypothetical protein